ncbi:unnamed protein product [Caenorhabditis bovis]|uniref:3-oxo-5alpha-steroid 4-dehydrogenase (NADP(+)) n=1 Tax=Caenorhabditis bovis TaxID=2654633 RepID=A0A8S1FDL0_9PELO|nr:unnamed protein product [Caenorhabditis bovis]
MYHILIGLSWMMIVIGILTAFYLTFKTAAGYGRYAKASRVTVPAKICWFVQEAPAFFIPLYFTFYWQTAYGLLANSLFMYHYAYRTFVYPFSLKSGNNTPLPIFIAGFSFCVINGFMQGAWNSKYQMNFGELSTFQTMLMIAGIPIFVAGHLINKQSDSILSNLRKPGETSYKIPKGGMFEYVSCANYFGEIVEWCGYAMFTQSLPSVAFAIFTASNIGPRALTHHQWYLEKFPEYPKQRKAVIPFVL